jgi:hypothetical protein
MRVDLQQQSTATAHALSTMCRRNAKSTTSADGRIPKHSADAM